MATCKGCGKEIVWGTKPCEGCAVKEKLIKSMREALVQARGALLLDAMVDDNGEFFGTTAVTLKAIDDALRGKGGA